MKREQSGFEPFKSVALAVPTIEAAIGNHWLTTLLCVSAAGGLVRSCGGMQTQLPQWVRKARAAALILVAGFFLSKASAPWPGAWSAYAVPGVLTAMAYYAVSKGKETAVRSASVLRYGMFTVLLVLALSGIGEIRVQALTRRPEWPTAELILVLLLPLVLAEGKGNGFWLPIAALTACVLSAGRGTETIYEYSRGLSIKGVTENVESLAACAVAMGWYGLTCMLMVGIEKESGKLQIWKAAIIWLISTWNRRELEPICLILTVLLWAAAPMICGMKKKWKKEEKSA